MIRCSVPQQVALAAFISVAVFTVGGVAAAQAPPPGDEASVDDVVAARQCAAETRRTGQAFAAVRDILRARGPGAEQSLTAAEQALASAREACRRDAEVLYLLGGLAEEAAAIRRALQGR